MEFLIKCFLLFTGRKSPDSWHIIGIENAFNWCYELRKQKTGFLWREFDRIKYWFVAWIKNKFNIYQLIHTVIFVISVWKICNIYFIQI